MNYKVWASYFSATGTTERAVERIAQKAADVLKVGKVEIFDFTLPGARENVKEFSKEDLVIFGVPVYAGRVPNVLVKYLHTIKGNGALAVPVVCYGNRNFDDALIELRDILEEDGFLTIAGAAFIGEHSFSTILAAGRPDVEDLRKADHFAEEVCKLLPHLPQEHQPVKVEGEEPYRPYYVPRDRKGEKVNILKVKPKTNDDCINCGLCARVCPMGSISAENVREFIGICIKCGACVKKCPQHAKYYDDHNYLYHQSELELGFERRAEPVTFLSESME